MEILEEDVAVETGENQIDFDFLEDRKTSTQLKQEWAGKRTLVVLVRTEGEVDSDFSICGKKMIEWVAMASCCCEQKVVDDADAFEIAKTFAEDYENIAVLYGNTPLLKSETFAQIMNYFSNEGLNVLQLPRGYVFKSEFLKTAKMILSQNITNFGTDDFCVVDDATKLSLAFEKLNRRILAYHKQNGVILFGENTIFVDADVEIEKGCVIYPNNVLKGKTYVGHNVVLQNGNYIADTILCEGVSVCQSYLENSKIENRKRIGPFERIVNQKI